MEENSAMAESVRVRLYWDDGRIEEARHPIDAEATMIIRLGKDGTHHHFELTEDIDADGFVVAIEVPIAS
jgi:hypothetical protein